MSESECYALFRLTRKDKVHYALLSEDDANALKGKIPGLLLQLFKEEGFFSFENDMYWFVNPLQMKPLAKSWGLGDDNYVFLRTAFGDFFTVDITTPLLESSVGLVKATAGYVHSRGILSEFLVFGINSSTLHGKLLGAAQTKLGKLGPAECYAFKKPLFADGKESAGNLEKGNLAGYVDKLARLHGQKEQEWAAPAAPIVPADNAELPAAKGPFTDFNFKLAVISALHEKGHYGKEAKRIKKRSDFDEAYVAIPQVATYYRNLEIPKSLLDEITHLSPDGGDLAYQHITTEWDGEDGQFDISSIEGIGHLVNLKKFDPISMISEAGLDFSPILNCPNLEYVAMKDWASSAPVNADVSTKLKARGVEVA